MCQPRCYNEVMRPLYHPPLSEITVEGLLYALTDSVRVRIFAGIVGANCSVICSNFAQLDDRTIPKSTLSVHFKVLRESGLIRSERRGVEMHNSSRCEEINEKYPGLLESILKSYAIQQQQCDGQSG